MSAASFSPQETAIRLGVPERTLRHWSTRFAEWLTPAAVAVSTGKGSRHRRYTEADLTVLEQIRQLAARRVALETIAATLGEPRTATLPADLGRPARPGAAGAASSAAPAVPSRPAARTVEAGVATVAVVGNAEAVVALVGEAEAEAAKRPASTAGDAAPRPELASERPAAPVPTEVVPRVQRDLVVRPEWLEARPAEPSFNEQLAGIDLRLSAIEATLADLAVQLAEIIAASPRPASGRWWWPFGRRARRPAGGGVRHRLARLLAERMLTRHELATRAGLPPPTVQGFLSGRTVPSSRERAALAAALEVEEAVLAGPTTG